MNSDVAIKRAQLLMQQDRHEQAQEILGAALATDPEDGFAHALMALCLSEDRDQLIEATREAELAIHLEPDQPYPQFVLAVILDKRNQRADAEEAIVQAIAIDPTDADFYGFHSYIQSRKKNNWQATLDTADRGLAHDPEHDQCGAIRSLALERLGRLDDAVADADRAIQNDPDSTDAHASKGWGLLQKGDYRKAQESFREALRLQPSNEFARQGMVQSLNSSNVIFRAFNGMLAWLSRLDTRVQTGLFIGFWIGVNLLNQVADKNPALLPWVLPISIFYLLFVMMSWIINPLFNTFLRFNQFGKHLLSKREIWASNCIASCLAFGIIVGPLVAYLNREPIAALLIILHAIYLTIPISVAFRARAKWAKWVCGLVAVGFTLLYLFNTGSMFANRFYVVPFRVFTFGILIYCFVGSKIASAEDRV